MEVTCLDGTQLVADITADQFGYDPVVVLPLREAATRYKPGHQQAVDEAVAELASDLSKGKDAQ